MESPLNSKYRPYAERTVDGQYKRLIREVMEKGIRGPGVMVGKDGKEVDTIDLLGPTPCRFNLLENGVPLITEREIGFWKSSVGELLGFINGARTQTELESYGCKWWKFWATPAKCQKRGLAAGDLGPGSYGAAFANFPTAENPDFIPGDNAKGSGGFDQISEILQQMKERPELKAHFISPWIPQYTIRNKDHQQKVVVVPCHGWMHFRIIGDKISLVMFQRSCDILIGCPTNWIQYSALLLTVADLLNLQPYEFVHLISDAHIYADQLEYVDEILNRKSHPFPTLKIVNRHADIHDYRPDDFALVDYVAEPAIKGIPAAI